MVSSSSVPLKTTNARAVLGACADVPDALYGPQVDSPDRLGDVLAVAAV